MQKEKNIISSFRHESNLNKDAQMESINTIINNFFILDHSRCGICFPNSIKKYDANLVENSLITTEIYFNFYMQYLDNNILIPYKYRSVIDILGIRKYWNQATESLQIIFKILCFPLYILKIIVKTLLNFYKLKGFLND